MEFETSQLKNQKNNQLVNMSSLPVSNVPTEDNPDAQNNNFDGNDFSSHTSGARPAAVQYDLHEEEPNYQINPDRPFEEDLGIGHELNAPSSHEEESNRLGPQNDMDLEYYD